MYHVCSWLKSAVAATVAAMVAAVVAVCINCERRFYLMSSFWTREGSQSATTVVVVVVEVVVTVFEKMPKAFLIRNGLQRYFAYTFVTSFPTDLPFQMFNVYSY